jgi:hypothetical protein
MRVVFPVPAMPSTMITVGFFLVVAPLLLAVECTYVGASASRTTGGSTAVGPSICVSLLRRTPGPYWAQRTHTRRCSQRVTRSQHPAVKQVQTPNPKLVAVCVGMGTAGRCIRRVKLTGFLSVLRWCSP